MHYISRGKQHGHGIPHCMHSFPCLFCLLPSILSLCGVWILLCLGWQPFPQNSQFFSPPFRLVLTCDVWAWVYTSLCPTATLQTLCTHTLVSLSSLCIPALDLTASGWTSRMLLFSWAPKIVLTSRGKIASWWFQLSICLTTGLFRWGIFWLLDHWHMIHMESKLQPVPIQALPPSDPASFSGGTLIYFQTLECRLQSIQWHWVSLPKPLWCLPLPAMHSHHTLHLGATLWITGLFFFSDHFWFLPSVNNFQFFKTHFQIAFLYRPGAAVRFLDLRTLGSWCLGSGRAGSVPSSTWDPTFWTFILFSSLTFPVYQSQLCCCRWHVLALKFSGCDVLSTLLWLQGSSPGFQLALLTLFFSEAEGLHILGRLWTMYMADFLSPIYVWGLHLPIILLPQSYFCPFYSTLYAVYNSSLCYFLFVLGPFLRLDLSGEHFAYLNALEKFLPSLSRPWFRSVIIFLRSCSFPSLFPNCSHSFVPAWHVMRLSQGISYVSLILLPPKF